MMMIEGGDDDDDDDDDDDGGDDAVRERRAMLSLVCCVERVCVCVWCSVQWARACRACAPATANQSKPTVMRARVCVCVCARAELLGPPLRTPQSRKTPF